MSVTRAVSASDRQHGASWAFRRQVATAQVLIERGLAGVDRPYIALSGGKDSLVLLALTHDIDPTIPAIWADDELEYPETPTYVPSLCRDLGVSLRVVQGWARHAGWFDPWRKQPFWREPLPEMEWVGERMETWSVKAGYDCVLVGLRADEAAHRRQTLRRLGAVYDAVGGQRRIWPLAGWSVGDVWAYIAARDLPYHPAYDRLATIGVSREKSRIGPLPLADGWVLRAGWPETLDQLTARYPGRWE